MNSLKQCLSKMFQKHYLLFKELECRGIAGIDHPSSAFDFGSRGGALGMVVREGLIRIVTHRV